ncbi:stage III sporulation protein AB [Intestinimonas timonensis]|uniref:stage III sporulation protein AB n=1 Tax=Intestinimonas timonensis TaxID=1689270 RepID=UPI001F5FDC58|nr:stage III sporulation protein AB [Intestinimonas timonensis]
MLVPRMEPAAERFSQVAALLPWELRQGAERLTEGDKARAEELRLRAGRSPTAVLPEGEIRLPGCEDRPVVCEDLHMVLEVATQASTHAVLDRVRDGFVTVRGGHRVGLCGSTVCENGVIRTMGTLSSLSIRVAREVPGAAAGVRPLLRDGGRAGGTVILSPPGGGKTTLLRDLIRRLSDGIEGPPLRVGVADERGELAAMYDGLPMNDLGAHTDVLDGCPKAAALVMLLRAMNPQVLAADEVAGPEDAAALEEAAGCGVALLCTAHAASAEDLLRRPVFRRLVHRGVLSQTVVLTGRGRERSWTLVPLEGGGPC